ncbi:glycoside hydrolase family 2 TIM barrel-domain containing protein [Fastidiosipila sanguinis]|uniref:Glycoside hydrolase family 2 n=1 Tax=Fastidiosipila sanguinis TaxID=236753 RepID=A0A2S0KL36_9FIRM|nr:glycoside hydrolase family 2 TIM barrel-domain containing protein [Fastidiosipila sanguinis]AVM41753.1 glycoside hydrolase family 2 [Fastidiosipila sanguinis]
MRKTLNNDWLFQKQTFNDDLVNKPNENMWEIVNLPHDWLIFDVNNLYDNTIGFYRKEINLNIEADDVYYLHFNGIYMDSEIYINGNKAFEWKYGYTSFYFDASQYLVNGLNRIDVTVKHMHPNSRWYSGAGIYRDVYLLKKTKTHFVPQSLYISSIVDSNEKNAELEFSVEINGIRNSNSELKLKIDISDKYSNESLANFETKAESTTNEIINLDNVKLWSTKTPELYNFKIQLLENGQVIDEVQEQIGFRSLEFTSDRGLLLNGEKTLIKGVCMHHDLGLLGSAFNKDAAERQVIKLKDMGANAIRFSHNPPAPEYIDLCDKYGLMVIDEAFDMWQKPKTEFDYARFFDSWFEKDIEAMVKRDRNHPSLIMWSIGNEIFDTHVNPEAKLVTKKLVEAVKKYDPRSNAKVTFGSNFLYWEPTQDCAKELDVVGYNYSESIYKEQHLQYPDWIMYGAETASIVNSRGIYRFPYEKNILTDKDKQCSSFGNSNTSWGAPNFDFLFEEQAKHPYILGQFIWTGFDYIGEPTPYDTKNSYFGVIDTAGFEKDSFYHYKAAWTDPREEIVLHLAPYWDFNPGQEIDVVAVSNAHKLELYHNGNLIGSQNLNPKEGNFSARWKVDFTPGFIEVIAYDESGNELKRVRNSSFSDAKSISVNSSKSSAKIGDLIFYEITLVDENGIEVANANNLIEVTVSGGGQLIGLDNGDSTDYDQYRGNVRRLFSGKLLAIVQATAQEDIKVEFSAVNLSSATHTCSVSGLDNEKSIIKPSTVVDENILEHEYIRKIEIEYQGSRLIQAPLKDVSVKFRVYPENASVNSIDWFVTDVNGVEIENAKIIEVDEVKNIVKFEVHADGEFYIRAMANNDKLIPQIISQVRFVADGFGDLQLDPYNFTYAVLANHFSDTVITGREGGMSLTSDGSNWIAYSNLDFAGQSSNVMKISHFSYNDDTEFKIYKGLPNDQNRRLIFQDTITKKSVWQTFQEYDLNLWEKVNTGDVLSIEVNGRGTLQGFEFSHNSYQEVTMDQRVSIYGDDFTVKDKRIENIGNNVSIDLGKFNFDNGGANKIIIKGSTPLTINTIRVVMTPGIDMLEEQNQGIETQKTIELIEFKQSDEIEEQSFNINNKSGKYKVELVFMPGSNMTLESIRFKEEGDNNGSGIRL